MYYDEKHEEEKQRKILIREFAKSATIAVCGALDCSLTVSKTSFLMFDAYLPEICMRARRGALFMRIKLAKPFSNLKSRL